MSDEEKLYEEFNEWVIKTLKPLIDKAPERKSLFTTLSGIPIKSLYTPIDLVEHNWSYLSKLGFPGEYPFTRGIYPNMYRGRFWTFRQYSGFGSAEETNERYLKLLKSGQTGLSVAFDLPTQLGLDPDNPIAEPEVGKVGVSVPSIVEMDILFKDIPLDRITTSMTINATAAEILAMYIIVAESRGVSRAELGGTVQNDIIKEYIARKNYIYEPEPSMRYATDIIMFTTKEMPKWNPISISGYHYREAGANAIQEIGFTLASAIEYTKKVIERGMDVDLFAPRLSFFFAAGTDLFEEVAKFRAARRMWAKIMKEQFNAKKKESMRLRFHTQTSGASLTAQQPEVNIIRTTIQALAAILGGTQSLHVNSYDEAWALPTEKAVKISLRVQHVIAHESGVANVVDPLAGSYYVEWLTDEIEERAWKIIEMINNAGGMVEAIKKGIPQREIANMSYEYQKKIENRELEIVGVNIYREEGWELAMELLKVDPNVSSRVISRLKELKKNRDHVKHERALNKLRKIAENPEENIVPTIIEAIKAKATIGEISNVLREIWGEYKEPTIY
ncbi:MAG: acyl-CoA mutase large subunit family protein [Thermoprotei archaeon]|jgi:methylmalonyl-CoA mutase N-terminal domain/subunit